MTRDDLLASIDDTRRNLLASKDWLIAYALGNTMSLASIAQGRGTFPVAGICSSTKT
jgi:hypothetical protein